MFHRLSRQEKMQKRTFWNSTWIYLSWKLYQMPFSLFSQLLHRLWLVKVKIKSNIMMGKHITANIRNIYNAKVVCMSMKTLKNIFFISQNFFNCVPVEFTKLCECEYVLVYRQINFFKHESFMKLSDYLLSMWSSFHTTFDSKCFVCR